MTQTFKDCVRVAIGIVEDDKSRVLISKRKSNVHLADYWEFPGGKLEAGESYKIALRREFAEELNIEITSVEKLLSFDYQYDHQLISFQVYKIIDYIGEPRSAENQPLRWVAVKELSSLKFPKANRAIIDALGLPSLYMIADYSVLKDKLLETINTQISLGVSAIQFRAHELSKSKYIELSHKINTCVNERGVKLIVNCDLDWWDEINADAVHLTSHRMKKIKETKQAIKQDYYSAACHRHEDIELANQLKVRSILLGAVLETQSHPDRNTFGWQRFSQLCDYAAMPVYALGGLNKDDVKTARAFGAQGIAAIRAFM